MEKELHKDEWIEATLNSLEGIERVKAPAAAFEQIQQKLAEERKSHQESRYQWMGIAAAIALIVCANVFVISSTLKGESLPEDGGGYAQITSAYNLYEL